MLVGIFLFVFGAASATSLKAGDDELVGVLPSFECPLPSGYFSFPICDKYVICINDVANLWQCKFDYYYDLVYSGCNFPEWTDCSNRTLPGTTTTVKTTTVGSVTNPTFVCPESEGRFSNPYDCASFYLCTSNYPVLVVCQTGLLFNPDSGSCEAAENVDCGESPTPTTPETPAPTTQTAVQVTTTPIPATNLTTTSYPTTTSARTTTTARTTTSATTTSSVGFSCSENVDGIYPNPDACDGFIQCSNGQPNYQSCPGSLTFNPDILGCDFPENFPPPCGTRFVCPEPEGTFANPYACDSFYVCDNSLSYKQTCPPGLVFNPIWMVCDHKYNVAAPCGTCATC